MKPLAEHLYKHPYLNFFVMLVMSGVLLTMFMPLAKPFIPFIQEFGLQGTWERMYLASLILLHAGAIMPTVTGVVIDKGRIKLGSILLLLTPLLLVVGYLLGTLSFVLYPIDPSA